LERVVLRAIMAISAHAISLPFVDLAGSAAISWPFVSRAQQPSVPVIGYLDGSGVNRWFEAFQRYYSFKSSRASGSGIPMRRRGLGN